MLTDAAHPAQPDALFQPIPLPSLLGRSWRLTPIVATSTTLTIPTTAATTILLMSALTTIVVL